MRPASQHFFMHSCIYLRILIISRLATFLGTNSLSVLMCRKAVNQSTLVFQVAPSNAEQDKKTEYNDVKGTKEESGVKKVDPF